MILSKWPDLAFTFSYIGSEETLVADFDEDFYETIHLTQVALGAKPSKGPHTVFVHTEEGKNALVVTWLFLIVICDCLARS